MSITFEHILARELEQPRELLKSIRLSALVAGEDWREEPGRGIALTESGVEKIKGALRVPRGPVELEPADLVVVKLFPNPRVVDACREGEEGTDVVRVRIVNFQPWPLKKNRRLPGCVFDAEAGIWVFSGRAPR